MAFPIGILSRRTGCKIETIRYYESIGLLPAPPRSEGGHRQYGEEDARRLTFVRRARELGFPLESVRDLLTYAAAEPVKCEEVRAMTLDHVADVRGRIADLRRLERALVTLADDCAGDTTASCPVIGALNG